MKNGHRLILGSTVSMVGSWIALTAVLINLQSRGGPHLVTLYLFCLTLMPALFTRSVLARVRRYAIGSIWCFAEVSQAVLVLIMAVLTDYVPILIILVSVTAVMQNVAASAQMALVSNKVPETEQSGVLTAISSGSSLSLVLGPAVGGALVGWLGLQAVFIIQAICCICASWIVPWRYTTVELIKRSPSRGMSSYRPPEGLLKFKGSKVVCLAWALFAIFGLLFDSVEMPVFLDSQGLSPGQVGTYISIYGVGGVTVFVAATLFNWSIKFLSVSLILLLGTCLWLFGGEGVGLIGFALCGLGYALVNGAIRSKFNSVLNLTNDVPTADGWAWLFQLSLTCSAVGFAIITIFFYYGGSVMVPIVGLVLTGVCLVGCSLYGDGRALVKGKARS